MEKAILSDRQEEPSVQHPMVIPPVGSSGSGDLDSLIDDPQDFAAWKLQKKLEAEGKQKKAVAHSLVLASRQMKNKTQKLLGSDNEFDPENSAEAVAATSEATGIAPDLDLEAIEREYLTGHAPRASDRKSRADTPPVHVPKQKHLPSGKSNKERTTVERFGVPYGDAAAFLRALNEQIR